jgi:hypothetical protein
MVLRDPEVGGPLVATEDVAIADVMEMEGGMSEANARLIAAAPEMFDELLECLNAELRRRADLKNKSPAARYSDERVARIQAAIAKVRGGK